MPSKFLHHRPKNLVGIQIVMNRNMIVEVKQVDVRPAVLERIAFIEWTIEQMVMLDEMVIAIVDKHE